MLTSVNIAVFAPMPSARTATATPVNPGVLVSVLMPNRIS